MTTVRWSTSPPDGAPARCRTAGAVCLPARFRQSRHPVGSLPGEEIVDRGRPRSFVRARWLGRSARAVGPPPRVSCASSVRPSARRMASRTVIPSLGQDPSSTVTVPMHGDHGHRPERGSGEEADLSSSLLQDTLMVFPFLRSSQRRAKLNQARIIPGPESPARADQVHVGTRPAGRSGSHHSNFIPGANRCRSFPPTRCP